MEEIMQIILGSQSPKRKEILGLFSLPFKQVPSNFNEETISFDGDPIAYCQTLSQKKAETLLEQFSKEIILTADSVVYCEGKIYNKPVDEQEAIRFLEELGGRWQSVFTGVTVRSGQLEHVGFAETKLLLHKLDPKQIKRFHNHCYALDKAGGYSIEKSGNLIVSQMEGCYYNVLGLPIQLTHQLLLKVGIDLWDYLN
jgi:septum formation protein